MSKKNKFNDKYYIMNCDMPSDIFTVKGIKREYRLLAKRWHPDVCSEKEAFFIMSKINALYKEGMALIGQNRFYEKERLIYRGRGKTDDDSSENSATYRKSQKPQNPNDKETHKADDENVNYENFHRKKRKVVKKKLELTTTQGKHVRFKYIKRVMIELGFMYVSEEYILLEITKLKRRIFMDSINIINKNEEGYFKINLPDIVDNFETDTHGYIVLKKERGIEPIVVLETVIGYVKPLGCRKICEGIFYDLTALKYMGLTSTGINKDLWFIDVNTGKLINYGLFFYLHEFNAHLARAPKVISEILMDLKPKDTETMMIDLVRIAMIQLNQSYDLKRDDFHQWLETLSANSLEVTLAESQVFNRAIASVTTPGFNLERYYQSIC